MMKPIDYKHWFKFDFWTFEQAAYLICNINPDDENHISHISHEKFRRTYPDLFSSIDTYDKYLKLLNGTNFSEYGCKNAPTGSASLASIIKFTKKNNIRGFPSRLNREWGKTLNKSTTVQEDSAEVTKSTVSLLSKFHQMEDLTYDEITVTFLEGDFIELSARKATTSLTYQALKLRDMRKTDISLNSAGRFLATCLSNTPPKPDPKKGKHKAELKFLINSWFSLKGDPFQIVGTAPSTRYETKFSLKNEMNRASDRIKNRANHKNIEDTIETSSFDEEDDAAGEFLKEYE